MRHEGQECLGDFRGVEETVRGAVTGVEHQLHTAEHHEPAMPMSGDPCGEPKVDCNCPVFLACHRVA